MIPQPKKEASLGDLFSELATETSALIRQEVKLAKSEIGQKAKDAGKDAAMIGMGGFVAYGGFLTLLAALTLLLGIFMPLWVSALIVGAIVVGAGLFMVQRGVTALKQVDPAPRQTIETLKEDKEWAKTQIR